MRSLCGWIGELCICTIYNQIRFGLWECMDLRQKQLGGLDVIRALRLYMGAIRASPVRGLQAMTGEMQPCLCRKPLCVCYWIHLGGHGDSQFVCPAGMWSVCGYYKLWLYKRLNLCLIFILCSYFEPHCLNFDKCFNLCLNWFVH